MMFGLGLELGRAKFWARAIVKVMMFGLGLELGRAKFWDRAMVKVMMSGLGLELESELGIKLRLRYGIN